MIPRFSLQRIVENAIFHGIEPKGSGSIELRASRSTSGVDVTITDDGVGMSEEAVAGIYDGEEDEPGMLAGLGVRDVAERIRHVFGDRYGLAVESEEGRYTRVTISIPSPEAGSDKHAEAADS